MKIIFKVRFAMVSKTSQQRTLTFAYVHNVAKVLMCDYIAFYPLYPNHRVNPSFSPVTPPQA